VALTSLVNPHRCIERLKARNERLTAALDKRKGESELISMTLSRHEADSTALQMALQYWYRHTHGYIQEVDNNMAIYRK
jgi:RNase H-fold protein (predicted Holliday junction resolvase)